MKTQRLFLFVTVAAHWLGTTVAMSQGSLTPPGAPTPTMKTLAQIEPRTPLAAPATISNAGAYYLTTNIVGVSGQSGINLTADDVTLDLNGFALIGVPGSSNGIAAASARRNIAVRNGVIRGWGQAAVSLQNADNSQFENLRVTSNGSGLLAGNQSQVRNCTVTFNPNVAGISAGDGSAVQDCIVVSNAFRGIITGNSCRVAGCTVLGNSTGGNDGIAAGLRSTVQNCVTARNGTPAGTQGGGIAVDAGSSVIGCTAMSNAVEGIFVQLDSIVKDSACRDNRIGISTVGSATIQGCSAALNSDFGIWDNGGSIIANCNVTENGVGIVATNQTVVRQCVVAFNATDGIVVHEGCQVVENNCHHNSNAGVRATSTDNRIDRNVVTANNTGIRVAATLNLVQHNQSSNNTTNFSVVAGNFLGTVENVNSMNTNKNPHANFSF